MIKIVLLMGLALAATPEKTPKLDDPTVGSKEWMHELGQAKPGEYNDYTKMYKGIVYQAPRVTRSPENPGLAKKR